MSDFELREYRRDDVPALSALWTECFGDGPGFTDYMMGDPGYLAMVPRIRTFIPQSSVIGMLLEHEVPYTVIRSSQMGILQHEPYSWEVMGNAFLPVEGVSEDSRFLDATIKAWVAGMTNEERNELVDTMFSLLSSGDAETTWDLLQPKNWKTFLKTLTSDSTVRHMLSEELQNLLDAARQVHQTMSQEKQLEAGSQST